MKTSQEVRQEFLDFFASKEHRIVPSAPVIPFDDPTLLFTNAGMNQFKDVFLGTGKRDYTRCADTQKCIRVSGKHNDLEEVGHDGYHHTFFEMLGNWSFGDYYKKEAIQWAWELLTDVWKLDKKRLWATVFEDDEESFELWKTETDIDLKHILKFGAKDNFWEMGETGPCGPCSEIHYDFTPKGCKAKDVNAGNPDVMEIWNLVFIQYNRDAEGKLHDLPQKHVDTGMGFERMVRVLQSTEVEKKSNYETDVFLPLINELIEITGKEYSAIYEVSMNVIADHIRTLTFAIGDGAIPSNEGRGYVLRRVLRRAARYGRNLEMHKPFIYKLVDVLVNNMGNIFPEIVEKKKFIEEVIQGEEESFNETLDRGLKLFNDEIENMKKSGSKTFSGEAAFKLHDTFGFPIDLTELMAREKGYNVDENKFKDLMDEQKDRARSLKDTQLEDSNKQIHVDNKIISGLKAGDDYVPYNIDENNYRIETESLIHYKLQGAGVDMIILMNNPFYIESGGQVGDTGKVILNDNNSFEVKEAKNRSYVYFYNPRNSEIINHAKVIAEVDIRKRLSIQRNHSATHLVHEALRRVLGSHIKQMGSYLDDKLLRFDFPHFHKLKDDEIKAIEEMVNGKVQENIQVFTDKDITIEEAKKKYPNVRMFFGDKYSDKVRVVVIDDKFSVELCGGTHVKETSDIGLFKIVKEESISSGTRRIIALTGQGIIDYLNGKISEIENLVNELPEKYSGDYKLKIEDFRLKIGSAGIHDSDKLSNLLNFEGETLHSLLDLREKYLGEKKQTEKQLAKQKVSQATDSIDDILKQAKLIDDIKIVSVKFDVDNADELKEIADKLREKIGNGVGLLYSVIDNKVSLVAVVSDNLIKESSTGGLNAGKIVGDVAKLLGGGGGGKPHLATAGGKDVSKLNEAVSKFPEIVKKYLKP